MLNQTKLFYGVILSRWFWVGNFPGTVSFLQTLKMSVNPFPSWNVLSENKQYHSCTVPVKVSIHVFRTETVSCLAIKTLKNCLKKKGKNRESYASVKPQNIKWELGKVFPTNSYLECAWYILYNEGRVCVCVCLD